MLQKQIALRSKSVHVTKVPYSGHTSKMNQDGGSVHPDSWIQADRGFISAFAPQHLLLQLPQSKSHGYTQPQRATEVPRTRGEWKIFDGQCWWPEQWVKPIGISKYGGDRNGIDFLNNRGSKLWSTRSRVLTRVVNVWNSRLLKQLYKNIAAKEKEVVLVKYLSLGLHAEWNGNAAAIQFLSSAVA